MAEFELGTLKLNKTRRFLNFVGATDLEDTFRFRITDPINFNLSLTDMSQNANVRLYRDINNNGIIDSGDGRFIAQSSRASNADDFINLRLTEPGAYIVQVTPFGGNNTSYTLRLSNTGSSPSNLLPTEVNAGTLVETPFSRTAKLSTVNTSNIYRFTMGAVGNFNASLTGIAVNNNLDMRLIRDINSNGVVDSGDEVVRAAAGGNQNDSINVQSLVAGNYFLQTYLHSGTSSNYTLRMSNTGGSPSNLLGPEVNVGTLSTTPFSRFSTLSTNNASDTYSFTMGGVGNFNASLTGIAVNHNLDMRLIRDVNSNGVVDSGDEVIRAAAGGNQNDSINIRSLAAGNYVLQTYLHSGTSSNYTLRMSNTGGSPSNLVGPEVNVGTLSTTPFSRFSTLSNNNASDTYSFTMGSVGNFNASLTGIAASHDLDMRLIRDVNNNNIVDSGDVLVTSTAGGNRDEAINVRSLAAGNYLLQTYLYSGTSSSYTLRMSNTGNSGGSPSNLLPIETSIGTIGSPITRSGSVGVNNASDTFRFSMASSRRVTLNLIGLSADADLRLIRDANNNGIVDAGEVIGRSSASGTSNERLSMSLTGGVSYIAQVYFYSSTGSTSYNLGIAPSIIPFPF